VYILGHVAAPCNSVDVRALYARVRGVVAPCLEALLRRSENRKVAVSFCDSVCKFKTNKSGLVDVILMIKWLIDIFQN